MRLFKFNNCLLLNLNRNYRIKYLLINIDHISIKHKQWEVVNQEELMLDVSLRHTEDYNCKLCHKFILYRWADKAYKKANSGTKWKKPFMGASHAAGIVVEKVAVEAK